MVDRIKGEWGKWITAAHVFQKLRKGMEQTTRKFSFSEKKIGDPKGRWSVENGQDTERSVKSFSFYFKINIIYNNALSTISNIYIISLNE